MLPCSEVKKEKHMTAGSLRGKMKFDGNLQLSLGKKWKTNNVYKTTLLILFYRRLLLKDAPGPNFRN